MKQWLEIRYALTASRMQWAERPFQNSKAGLYQDCLWTSQLKYSWQVAFNCAALYSVYSVRVWQKFKRRFQPLIIDILLRHCNGIAWPTERNTEKLFNKPNLFIYQYVIWSASQRSVLWIIKSTIKLILISPKTSLDLKWSFLDTSPTRSLPRTKIALYGFSTQFLPRTTVALYGF